MKHLLLLLLLLGCATASPATGDAGSAGDAGADVVPLTDASFGEAAVVGNGCSSDLQSIVDSSGNVVQQCAPDQGCSNGTCIAACDAAAANHGNVGCDFIIPTPSFYEADTPPCFAVFLANNWPHDAHVTVTRGGQSYDVTQFGRGAGRHRERLGVAGSLDDRRWRQRRRGPSSCRRTRRRPTAPSRSIAR